MLKIKTALSLVIVLLSGIISCSSIPRMAVHANEPDSELVLVVLHKSLVITDINGSEKNIVNKTDKNFSFFIAAKETPIKVRAVFVKNNVYFLSERVPMTINAKPGESVLVCAKLTEKNYGYQAGDKGYVDLETKPVLLKPAERENILIKDKIDQGYYDKRCSAAF